LDQPKDAQRVLKQALALGEREEIKELLKGIKLTEAEEIAQKFGVVLSRVEEGL
jgi:hypothetical protein